MFSKNGVGILTFPNPPAGEAPLQNFIDIISALTPKLYLVTGKLGSGKLGIEIKNKIYKYTFINYIPKKFFLYRIYDNFFIQLKYSYQVIKYSRNVSFWMFFFGERGPLLPLVIAKLLGKKSILILGGSLPKILSDTKDPLAYISIALEKSCCFFSDKLILYSNNLINEWDLENYKHKILIASEHFVDLNLFNMQKQFSDRELIIGYVGRLSKEKGVNNLLKSVKVLLSSLASLKFIIAGDGELRNDVINLSDEFKNRISYLGWVRHDNLPQVFNMIKLLVIPSYTEGLPNVMLEAMACGTPVLATRVGAIPDIINDNITGFLLKNNNPKNIIIKINECLNDPNLYLISKNAQRFIEQHFTYDKAIIKWKKVFDMITITKG